MALKDLFGNSSNQIVVNKTLDDLHDELKTENFLDVLDKQNQRYIPNIDFSDPANFARFGSAEKYYVDGIKNIYQHYPYDGSKKEKLDWRSNSTLIDLHIFDNIYPKSNGYVNLSVTGTLSNSYGLRSSSAPQYVIVKGGPNVSSDGSFNASNIYDVNTNRESNLGITDLGNTLEFWFKDETSVSDINYNYGYALFDLWNNVTASNENYARATVAKVSGSNKFTLTYRSGSSGITEELIDYTFDSSVWHHYAFSFENININDLQVCVYVDGDLVVKNVYSSSGGIKLANNANAVAYVGSYRADNTGDISHQGLGVSRGSYDDLRFWKICRTSQDIYRNWFTSVHGGSNIDDFGANLGLYLKFNEGLVNPLTASTLDETCLDYSGRITNGNIVNYCIGTKITSSAIDLYFDEDGKEEKDPIIFSTNPLVKNVISTYSQLGFTHDVNNPSNTYKSLPAWITEEAEKLQLNDLSHLIQIISSYFDTLYIQIEHLTKLKEVEYISGQQKPKPFASYLLTSNNFDNLDLFNDASFLEKVLSRSENANFEHSLHEIKNIIYQNIYNNLAHIYKSKGTEKSFRNLIRCFGIDDELIKINLYSDNSVYDLENKYTLTSNHKKFVDFNNPDRFDGFVYQKRKPDDTLNTRSYIKSSTDDAFKYIPITVEAEVIFPKYVPVPNLPFAVNFQSSSLFGAHSAKTDQDDYVWNTGDVFNFQVYSVRTFTGSPDVKFILSGSFSGSSIYITSSVYKDVYSNSKWNFAVRISQDNYDQANISSGSGNADYNVELIGINSIADIVDNQFIISASVSNANMAQALKEHKRLYVGSHYEDFDNTKPLTLTDVKISSLRFWYDYLTNEEITEHSYDSLNYGRKYPNQTPNYVLGLNNKPSISSIETLVLNWDFNNVSSSDGSGQFVVEDVSSGSYLDSTNHHLGWFGDYVKYQHPGLGDEFLPNDSQVVNKEYSLSAKKQLPETINGNDLVQIPDTDDVTRIKDSKAITYYLSIEKSMAQVISGEMLNWFATIKGFNNILGNPAERYKKEYSGLNHLRELFYSQVGNSPDFEKFFEFYKWIDSSLSTIIYQLIPLSADGAANIRNTIESHLFERSKYENKLPSIEFKGEAKSYPVGSIQGFSYTEQAAYPNNLTDELRVSRYYNFKPLWLKQRVKRSDDLVDSPLEPQNDIDREIIRQVINHNNLDKLPTLFTSDGIPYEGNNDKSKIFSKTYKLSADKLYIFEDTITLGNVSNNVIDSQFKFASDNKFYTYSIVENKVLSGSYAVDTNDLFGSSISISSDGKTLVVGASYDETGSVQTAEGLAYVFSSSSIGWVNTLVLTGNNITYGGDELGYSVSINGDGTKIVVGARLDETGSSVLNYGLAYIFASSSNGWAREKILSSSYTINQSDEYGYSVSISSDGKTVVVGAPSDETGSVISQGLAYVYASSSNGWTEQKVLTGSYVSAYGYFGNSVSINNDGSKIIVGAMSEETGSINNHGLAYIFSSSSVGWILEKILTGSYTGDVAEYFGSSVSISGDGNTVVVGAPADYSTIYYSGLAYVFTSSSAGWLEQKALTGSLTNYGDYFGNSVSINNNGTKIVVGAYKDEISSITSQGLAYVFASSSGGWIEQKILSGSYAVNSNDYFGSSVSISGDGNTIVVGAPNDETGSITSQGLAYIFVNQPLQAPDQIVQPVKKIANYSNKYEYLQLSGRTINNKSFIDLTGNIPSDSGSNILGFTDRTLPVRNAYKNIIVEKFSAPGSPEASSRGALDKNAEEYSSYNSLNYRNSRVRKNLNKWLAETSSFSEDAPSIHQNPDNIARYPGDDSNTYTNVQNDNAFISHAIPRSDYQYAWITASMQSGTTFSGYSSEFTNLNVDYAFISGNTSGSSVVDFVGLNNTIVKTVDTSSNTVSSSNVSDLNKYLSNINGPYQHPSWKQIRGNESLISRVSKKENKILIQDRPSAKTKLVNGVYIVEPESRSQTFTSYKEMPVTFNKPMLHKIDIEGSNELVETISTYDNNIKMFGNDDLNNTLGLDHKTAPQMHDVLNDLQSGVFEPKPNIISTRYEQHLFPSDTYVGSADVRIRENYEDWEGNTGSIVNSRTFWRDSVNERARLSIKKDIYDYELENYSAYPNNKQLISYNNDINNIFSLDISKYRNSIFSLDNLQNYEYTEKFHDKLNTSFKNISSYNINLKSFDLLKQGLNDSCFTVMSSNNVLYAGGAFTLAGDIAVNNIARWDGFNWTDMSGGVDDLVNVIITGSDGVYVGGEFTTAGGNSANYIAKWDGNTWFPLSGGLSFTSYAINSSSQGLYVGGSFSLAGGVTVNNIAKWDGSSWSALSGGVSGPVFTVISGNDGLYVGGQFTVANGNPANYIAKWDGINWSNLGSGTDGIVYSIFSSSDGLYVGGNFTTAGGITVNNIARWDGSNWSALDTGTDSSITSIVSSSDGLYVGGYFETAGDITVNNIAKWDGTKWQRVDTDIKGFVYGQINQLYLDSKKLHIVGSFTDIATDTPNNFYYYDNNHIVYANFNSSVRAITYDGNNIFVGGEFNEVDNISAKHIAKWNGSSWSSIGAGFTGINDFYVNSIVSSSEGIYAGGYLRSVDHIAIFNGSSWSSLGSGTNDYVNIIISASDGLYIGGRFTTAGGNPANYIAKWDGTNWSGLGSGLNAEVTSMISGNNGLYVAGKFTTAGGNPANYIAKWDGTNWSAIQEGTNSYIYTILSASDGIYIGGNFTTAGGALVNNIAKWDGINWLSLQNGYNGIVTTISSGSDGIYVGGYDFYVDDTIANNIMLWNGYEWSNRQISKLIVNSIKVYDNKIFIGGLFFDSDTRKIKEIIYKNNLNGSIVNTKLVDNYYNVLSEIKYNFSNIAIYNFKENNMYNIKNNINNYDPFYRPYIQNSYINSIISGSDGIYIGGEFGILSETSIINIAKWDGTSWSSLGSGISEQYNYVSSIYSGSDGLYAGGYFYFEASGGINAYNIAKWNGSIWQSLNGGTNSPISTVLSSSDGLYVGGLFTEVGDVFSTGSIISASRIAKWDGTNWSALGSGMNYAVYSIISCSDGIYAGGDFTTAGGNPANYIAKWDGTNWSALGSGMDFWVYCIISGSDGIYAGGAFGTADGNPASAIAKWDGISWSALANGINGVVRSIASSSYGIYVGGEFTSAGNVNAYNIAKWDGVNWSYIGKNNNLNGFNLNSYSTIRSLFMNEDELLIGGLFSGIRYGPNIKDKRYNNYFEAYYNANTVYPRPNLIFNNFIPSSVGSKNGMLINEITYNQFKNINNIEKYSSNECVFILNEGYNYETNIISNKSPFFNSYLEYLSDIKFLTKKYSLIPEYTISDYISSYVIEKNANFNSILETDYLKLEGKLETNIINNSNIINSNIIFNNDNKNENINLNIKVSGIKKLIPSRDFYSSERIITLSNYFINSFLDLNTKLTSVLNSENIYSSSLSNGTPINKQILTLLQPILAPGILLNTIKSSVAVDWPMFITNSVSYDSITAPEFYSNTGSNLITTKIYNKLLNQYYDYTSSNYINKEQNYRLPFEGIIEFDTRIPEQLRDNLNNIYYLNPTYYTSDILTGSDNGLLAYPSYNMGTGSLKPFVFRDNNYKLAMHNFLAEIPNFFLDGKLSNIVSLPENKFKSAQAGKTYYMDVVLERDSRYKEFIADPYYEGLKAQANSFYDGTFLLPSPDSLYGPPTRYWHTANPYPFFDRSPYNFYSKLLDTPAYAPYVPPYYYGKAIARISFKAEDTRQYTLAEIQNSCSVEYINSEAEALFLQRSNFINGNFTDSFVDNYKSSPAYKQMMKISSSVNLFLAADTKLTKQDAATGQTIDISDSQINNQSWVIQTKFETPSINFIDSDLSENIGLKFLGGTKESGSVKGIYSYMMKGLWTTYGEPVKDGEGIKLYIQESYPTSVSNNTGSLIDLCGFNNALDQKKTIGLLAERKKVSECMVMIPYTYNKNHGIDVNTTYAATLPEILGENGIYESSQTGNGPYYYAINENLISQYLGGINFANASVDQIKAAAEASEYKDNSIIKLILAMIKFVVPPHLDWIRNKNIKPFVMYTAEFSTEFDKQDLSDIWQGVMPKQSYNAEIEDISINHKFVEGEFFHGKRPQNDTKFKIFKIKQRANINYYKLTDSSKDDDRFKFTFGNSQQATVPEYSYNWPYDFFSLVELVNVEAGLEYSKSDSE